MNQNTAAHLVSTLAHGTQHLPKVTYRRTTDSYIATCPQCTWTAGPSLSLNDLHAAANEHYATVTR